MLNLIRLELKKTRISKYFMGGCIASMVVFTLICVVFIVEKYYGRNYSEIFSILESIAASVSIVVAATLYSEIVIGEYDKKTINVLYTYPIGRKQIMLSKMILVCSFTFIMNLAMTSIMYAVLYVLQNFLPIFNSYVSVSIINTSIINLIIPAFSNALLTLIPLYFGLRKKSRNLTIGLSFLLCTVLYSNGNGFSLASIRIIPILIALVAVILAYFAIIRKVETEDIIA